METITAIIQVEEINKLGDGREFPLNIYLNQKEIAENRLRNNFITSFIFAGEKTKGKRG